MELLATGFNAFNQLQFDPHANEDPRDLKKFTCVLTDEPGGTIEILFTSIGSTLVRTSSGTRRAGAADAFQHLEHAISDSPMHIAIAGNSQRAVASGEIVKQYPSIDAYLRRDGKSHILSESIKQIVANQTGFAALSEEGKVWTWGDVRYESCLGRDVTEKSPASEPAIVEDLSGLPMSQVKKLASGGYTTAALTTSHDLYMWGGRPNEKKVLEDLSGSPFPIDLQGKDILDVGVGIDHVIALTTDHKVFVVGAGKNGQLGMDIERLGDWEEVSLPLKDGQQIVGVAAGYKNSFVLRSEK